VARIVAATVAALLLLSLVTFSYPKGEDSSPATNGTNQTITNKLHSMDGYFIENRGQVADGIRYYSRGNPSVGFKDDGVMFLLTEIQGSERTLNGGFAESIRSPIAAIEDRQVASSLAYLLRFEGANSVRPVGNDRLQFNSNFFIGNDSDNWRTDVPNYQEVVYHDLYDGIDLVYRQGQTGLKYEFVVDPGADVGVIRMRYEGIESLGLNGEGIVVRTAFGDAYDSAPRSFQENGEEIRCTFVITDLFAYGFSCKDWDISKALVIDPLVYSTYLGGSGPESAFSVAVDKYGSAYVTGCTISLDFPVTPGAYDESYNHYSDMYTWDTYVVKLNPTGSSLVYSTFLGGKDMECGDSIALDSAGNAHITGQTMSSEFPVTPGAFDTTLPIDGDQKYYVTKVNATGSQLIFSTLLDGRCGMGPTCLLTITVDSAGYVYVAGYTGDERFPTTPGAFDTTFNGGFDAVVTKLKPDGSALVYSTFLGGSGNDGHYLMYSRNAIAVDSAGNAYLTGYTDSSDFPITPDALDTTLDDYDAYVCELSASGSALLFSTYLGGTMGDYGTSIALDSSGNAYVLGWTFSRDFPVTSGAFDTSLDSHRWSDVFVTKLDTDRSAIVYSTFLGGDEDDYPGSIMTDFAGDAYVTGFTSSANFPTTPGSFDTTFNGFGDAFVAKLDAAGSALVNSTFLGGSDSDMGWDIALDSFGSVYVTGVTRSTDFPAMPGSFDTTYNGGGYDAFVVKLDVGSGANTPPEILSFAASPSPSFEGGTVLLAVNATDADGDALTYDFDFESDGVFDVSGPSSTATHIYGDDFNGTATMRVSDGNLSTEATTPVIVLNVPPTIDGVITATATFDVTLRVAGEKWHDISAYVVDDGNETLMASLVREPGKPQETSFEISIDATKSSSLRIAYTPDDDKVNGQPNGANPAWLTFTFDSGPPVEIHHTFNVRHPDTWNWTVSLNLLLAGRDITFTATATDPGSDDLTFTWEWGDGSPATAKTYYNDGIGPDPYPSPGGTFPFAASDSEIHAYQAAGMYELKLIVRDDDGGTTEIPLVVVIV